MVRACINTECLAHCVAGGVQMRWPLCDVVNCDLHAYVCVFLQPFQCLVGGHWVCHLAMADPQDLTPSPSAIQDVSSWLDHINCLWPCKEGMVDATHIVVEHAKKAWADAKDGLL